MSLKLILLFLLPGLIHCACPDGFIQWHSDCYFFGTNETQFTTAETKCDSIGGNLASIHDGFVNALLTQNSGNYFHASTDIDFWVGGTNLMSPPNWTWTDGTPFDFQGWSKGDPLSAQSCLAVNMINGSWSAQDCFQTKPFVCKVNETATTPYPTSANCTVGWYYLDITQSCYGTVTSMQTTWNTSEATCQTYGAHLPSIHSYEEETFLRSLEFHYESKAMK
uniref:C-type lectin domain-containing protein n=1 Tax=Panagrolaimus superbus TaxID=310955 RepID=A0A914Y169_9BILA